MDKHARLSNTLPGKARPRRLSLCNALLLSLALSVIASSVMAQLSGDVLQALDAMQNGTASEQQRALLFKNNDAINAASLNGWIPDSTYQKVQGDYARLNQRFAADAAREAGAGFRVQTASAPTYSPGTDSDYITVISDPKQVEQMQRSYNQRINDYLRDNNVLDQSRTDWHNRLDTDFMADPTMLRDEEKFRQVAKLNNDAYKRRQAAKFEAASRAQDGLKVTPEQFRDYGEEMRDFIQKKQKLMKEMRANPERLSDPALRAEYHRLMAQEQKYISRIESANDTLRTQEGLGKLARDPGAPMYEVFRDADGKLVMKRQLHSGNRAPTDPRIASREIQMGHDASLAKRAAKRSAENFGTTGAGSAVGGNAMDRALAEYAESMAEASRRSPAFAARAAEDIADLVDHMPASAKGELLDRIRRTQGMAFTEKVASAMRQRAAGRLAAPGARFAASSEIAESARGLNPAQKGELIESLKRTHGEDFARDAAQAMRKQEARAVRRLSGRVMDALGAVGVAADLYDAASNASTYLDNMATATDPNISDEDAKAAFAKAQQAAERLAAAGGFGALMEASPTFAAAFGSWTIGFHGGRWVLENTETGQWIGGMASDLIERMAGDYIDRQVRAVGRAACDITDLLGGRSDCAIDAEQTRKLESAYWRAIREGRLRMKPGVRTTDIRAALRVGDIEGARDLVERVDNQRKQRLSGLLAQGDTVLPSCERTQMEGLRSELAEFGDDSDQAAALLEKLIAEIAVAEAYSEAELAWLDGDLAAVRSQLALVAGSHCAARRADAERLAQQVDSLQQALTAGQTALESCDTDALAELKTTLAGFPVVSAQQMLAAIDDQYAALRPLRDARRAYREGRLEAAQVAISKLDPTVCAAVTGQIGKYQDKIARMRKLMQRVDQAVSNCKLEQARMLRDKLATGRHVLIQDALQRIDQMLTAATAFDQATAAWIKGDLEQTEALLDIAAQSRCTDYSERIAERRAKLERLREVLKTVDQTLASCDAAAAAALRDRLMGRSHLLLQQAVRTLGRVVDAHADNDAAKAAYTAGKLRSTERHLTMAQSELDKMASDQCTALQTIVAQRQDKLARLRKLVQRIDSAAAACRRPVIKTLLDKLSTNKHALVQRKLRQLRVALRDCSKPRPKLATSKTDKRSRAQRDCRARYGTGADIGTQADGSYYCRCGDGYLKNETGDHCLPEKQVIAAGERYCSKLLDNGVLIKAEAENNYQCGCPQGKTADERNHTCLDRADIVALGREACARSGKVLGMARSYNDYACCPRDMPHYQAEDNSCNRYSAEQRRVMQQQQQKQAREQRQRQQAQAEAQQHQQDLRNAQEVMHGLTNILRTINGQGSSDWNVYPGYGGTGSYGGSSGSSGGHKDRSNSGKGSGNARCESLARQMAQLANRQQSIMSRGGGNVECELWRTGKRYFEVLQQGVSLGCPGFHAGSASFPAGNTCH